MSKIAKILLVGIALLIPSVAEAQKKPKPSKVALPKAEHVDFNLVGAEAFPDTLTDTLAVIEPEDVYVKYSGSTVIHVASDSVAAVVDADGTDGEASITLPTGEYQVFARAVGKAGSSATLNGTPFSKAKGKPQWSATAGLPTSGDWTYENTGMGGLNLRFYTVNPAP